MTNSSNDTPEKMKRVFTECYKAILACEDETGRKRHQLFIELPDRRDYPDYYEIMATPIALRDIERRINEHHYKDVQAFRDDWRLLFANATTYNQEGSWVYVDSEEMEQVFDAFWNRAIVGSGLPGAPAAVAP